MSKMRKPMILLLLLFINLLALVRGQEINPYLCTPNGNYSSNSTYSTNLNTLLTSLPSNMSIYGFYKSSLGRNKDSVYALALCIADLTPDQCRECIGDAARELLASCQNQRQGIVWLAYRLVRYSDDPIPPTFVPDVVRVIIGSLRNTQKVLAGKQYFREDVTRILVEAANGSSEVKVGVGTRRTAEVNASTIYALLQCTPDLTSEHCRQCLAYLSENSAAPGMSMLHPKCITRYELYSFNNETRLRELRLLPPLPPSPPPPGSPITSNSSPTPKWVNSGGNKNNNIKKVVMIVVPIGVCLALAASALIFLTRRMKRPTSHQIIEGVDEFSTVESLQYELSQIRAATEDFHDSNKLGQGGFGAVYTERLFNGQEIAVKRLSQNSGQGKVLLVARLQHRNLTKSSVHNWIGIHATRS